MLTPLSETYLSVLDDEWCAEAPYAPRSTAEVKADGRGLWQIIHPNADLAGPCCASISWMVKTVMRASKSHSPLLDSFDRRRLIGNDLVSLFLRHG